MPLPYSFLPRIYDGASLMVMQRNMEAINYMGTVEIVYS
jgi:hypothetical protein